MGKLGPVVSKPTQVASILTPTAVSKRIVNYMGHALRMLENLEQQHAQALPTFPSRLKHIYSQAQKEIRHLNKDIQLKLNTMSPERAKEIAHLRAQREKITVQFDRAISTQTELIDELNKLQQADESKDIKKKQYKLIKKIDQLEKESHKTLAKLKALDKKLAHIAENLSKKEIKKVKGMLARSEERIVSIIHRTQVEAASEIAAAAETDPKKAAQIKSKVASLAQGGLGAKWIHFLSIVSKTHRQAIAAFDRAKKSMIEASSSCS